MTLLIKKEIDDYFSFLLNGDSSTEVLNARNDLTTVGTKCHFKTSNGANIISSQNITPADVTIVDGATTLNPLNVRQLFSMLRSVGYFDWITDGGGSGVDRFDELDDTFAYFGQNGKVPVVDEAQMKLKPVTFHNVSKFVELSDVPSVIVADKILASNHSGDALIFVDAPPAPSDPNKLDKGTYGGTAYDLKTDIDNVATDLADNYYTSDEIDSLFTSSVFPKIQLIATAGQTSFDIVTTILARSVFWNGIALNDNDWSQSASIITTTFPLSAGDIFKPV